MTAMPRQPAAVDAVRIILAAGLQPALFALVLFWPAETFAWWRAWVLIAVVAVAAVLSLRGLARHDPALLAERFRPPIQAAQPIADRVVLLVFLAAYLGAVLVVPFDVFRWRLLPRPPAWLSTAGLALFVVGWWIVDRALRANTFAAPVVKSQPERGQRVIDTGPYAIVRHPMYAGAVLLLVGLPLWLESITGVVASLVPIALLAVRIRIEEAVLRAALPAYESYAARVRARLVPGIW